MYRLLRALAFLVGFSVSCWAEDLPDGLYTEITTESGVVICEIFYDKTPLTAASYVGLAEGTLGPHPRKPFFDGLKWHRVVPGFVAQGGDPTATGDGGPGYLFADEIVPGLRHDGPGTLQMANDGPDTNGSQYCLMLSAQQRLNYLHTVFGKVVRGMEILSKIKQGDTMNVKILRFGDRAKAFRADDAAFAALSAKATPYKGPREPGPDAPFDDPDKLLPAEWDRAKAFNFKLANVERFTGIGVAARVFASMESPGAAAWLARESARLAAGKRAASAAYFADSDQWSVRVDQESGKGLNISTLLAESGKAAEEFIEKSEAAATPEKPVSDAHRRKLKVDAMLDALIFALERLEK
jgi:cyclophilin family peptidyl-prolyl cis-trans isomerase